MMTMAPIQDALARTIRHIHPFAAALTRFGGVAAVVAAGLIAGGCASTGGEARRETAAATISPEAARAVTVYRGESGEPVTWAEIVSTAAAADAVIIGENHGHPLGLATAAALWKDVLEQSPRAALSMEFMDRDEQARLDDYVTGLIDEAALVQSLRRTDQTFPAGHRAMVRDARAAGRPVIAANAPRRYVRLARTDGFETLADLTAAQRRLFRIPDTMPGAETRYRADFDRIMASGGRDPGEAQQAAARSPEQQSRLDATFRSQSMWDWTMAESIAMAIQAGEAPVVHVVGRFHSDFEGGLIQALRRLRPEVRTTTISFVDESTDVLKAEDRGRADFVIYVGSSGGG